MAQLTQSTHFTETLALPDHPQAAGRLSPPNAVRLIALFCAASWAGIVWAVVSYL